MPNYTTNLKLEKPLADEQYNIDVFNSNADKIDQFAGQVPARALTADKLTTGAKINGVNFKGDMDIELPTLNKNQITNCILEAPNGVATYSGSTITVKSGIKVLIPNGRNADGTLNNIEYITQNDNIYTEQTSRSSNDVITIAIDNQGRINAYTEYYAQENNPNRPYTCWYKPSENNFYTSNGLSNFSLARIVPILIYKSSNLQITNVIPYNTVDLLKRSDKSEISSWSMPSDKYIDLTLGASGTTYTAPANGYYQCYIGGQSGYKWLRLYTSAGYLQEAGFSTDNNIGFTVPIQKGQTLNVKYSGTLTNSGLKFIYAEGSESEAS